MIRSLAVGLATGILILLLGPLGIVAAWISGSARPLYVLSTLGIRCILLVAGIRLVVRGHELLDPDETYVFVANHVSNLDPPVAYLATRREIRTLAKAEVFNIPIFGRVLKMAGFPAVHRKDRASAVAALTEAAAVLAAGHDFMAFPEGTRSKTGRLGEFKKGPFVMAIQAQKPVAPMVLRGTREVWPRGTMRLSTGTVEIDFLEPVQVGGLIMDDRDTLRLDVRARIAAHLGEASTTDT